MQNIIAATAPRTTAAFLNGVLITSAADNSLAIERGMVDTVKAAMPGARIVLTGRIVGGEGRVALDYRSR